jgi:hypothetical protein
MDALVLLGGFVVFCFMGVPVAYALGLSAICAALWMDFGDNTTDRFCGWGSGC